MEVDDELGREALMILLRELSQWDSDESAEESAEDAD